MKKFKLVTVSLALFAVIWGLATAARADDKQAISDLERKIATITNGDEAMKYWDSGDDVVLFDIMGPPREFAARRLFTTIRMSFRGTRT